MKVPVYLERSLELIGVVDVDSSQLATLQNRRSMRLVRYNPLPLNIAPSAPIDEDTIVGLEAEFRYFPLRNGSGADTICLTVARRAWLECWPKQLWPRRRSERRRRRRSYGGGRAVRQRQPA